MNKRLLSKSFLRIQSQLLGQVVIDILIVNFRLKLDEKKMQKISAIIRNKL